MTDRLCLEARSPDEDMTNFFSQTPAGNWLCEQATKGNRPYSFLVKHHDDPAEIVKGITFFFGKKDLVAMDIYCQINAAGLGITISERLELCAVEPTVRQYILKRSNDGHFALERRLMNDEDEQSLPGTLPHNEIIAAITEFYGDDDTAQQLYRQINKAYLGFEIELSEGNTS